MARRTTARCRRTMALALLSTLALSASAVAADETAIERVSFDVAIHRALQHTPAVRIAVEEIRRAGALLEEVRSASLPTLVAAASYTRLDHNRVSNGVITLNENETTGSLTATIPLLAPQRWAAWAHAHDAVEVSKYSAADVQRRLAVLTAHTYLTLVSQHRVIDVQERARQNAQAHLEYTHARFVGGIGPQLDETRAAQELDADVSQLEVAYSQLALLEEALGVLIAADHPVDSELGVELETPPELPLALDDAHHLRTDLRLAHQQLDAARHLVRDDYTDYLPTLFGSVAPFFTTPPTPTYPPSGWQAQLTLSLPLYDGGLRYGQAHERNAIRDEAAISLEGVERQVSSDVRAATVELARARRSLLAARSSANNAEAALAMTNQAYKAGATTNIEVIDAERRARDADTAAAVSEDAVRQATIDLLAATGRFPR